MLQRFRPTYYIVFLATCAAAMQAPAAEPRSVNLFDRDSLAGWEHGASPAKCWRMADGVLTGGNDSTPLVSGWSWQDVEMTFRWKVELNGRWAIKLLPVGEESRAASLTLAEGNGVRGDYDGKSQSGRIVIAPSAGGWHNATLQRKGGTVTLNTASRAAKGGEQKSGVSFSFGNDRFALELSLAEGSGSIADLKATEPPGQPLYNGKNLDGWWTPGNLQSWKPEADGIVLVNNNGNYLRTEREYANFTLSLEYKMAKGGNSGIGIRTARNGWPSGDGMELQMLDERPGTPMTRHSTMAIYGNLEPLARADRSQERNRLVIKAEGYMISAWVNGVLVQHANTAELPELRRRNLKGWIGLQDHGARTEFRDLQLLEAPDGLGLPAWQKPRPMTGSQLVLERLMNPERLAIDDGLDSGVAVAGIKGKGEQVLAELTGPAAIVVVSRTNQAGRLAFYFDGESTPRLECPADTLHEHLPLVGQDTQPLLTFLPFHKSLKVMIDGGKPAEYRFDYVIFPDRVPLEEFGEGRSCVARGLLPALSYRNEQLGWGTHREADPLPRAGSEGQKIDEQSQATLVDLKGPGIVEWTKLIAAPSLLNDDELWLEVTIDDEPSPALAAPARYFFPGLASGNYPNYVVLNRNGWTNMLAMPFRTRLTMALANRGRRPVNPVGLMVSYQPLTDASDPRLAGRLRGVFATDDDSTNRTWVKQSGSGRFIGFITQYGKGKAGIDALLIDGQPRPGWHSPDRRILFDRDSKATSDRHSLSGGHDSFQWRFFLLAPPRFARSFELRATEGQWLGPRLALFYIDATK